MAISVKNLDDRLKVLESIKPAESRCVKLLSNFSSSGNKTLPESMTNFDYLVLIAVDDSTWKTIELLPVKCLTTIKHLTTTQAIGESNQSVINVKFISNTSINVSWLFWNFGVTVYGLKIYYIFRYNILVKILRSNISRFSHFLHQNTNFGGEFRWLFQ